MAPGRTPSRELLGEHERGPAAEHERRLEQVAELAHVAECPVDAIVYETDASADDLARNAAFFVRPRR